MRRRRFGGGITRAFMSFSRLPLSDGLSFGAEASAHGNCDRHVVPEFSRSATKVVEVVCEREALAHGYSVAQTVSAVNRIERRLGRRCVCARSARSRVEPWPSYVHRASR